MSVNRTTPTIEALESKHNHDLTDDLDGSDEAQACGITCISTTSVE